MMEGLLTAAIVAAVGNLIGLTIVTARHSMRLDHHEKILIKEGFL